jgi:Activator of Hsp90 ATPase homolog 1-like protein
VPHSRERVRALADLRRALEGSTMSPTEFVYVSCSKTTSEKLWGHSPTRHLPCATGPPDCTRTGRQDRLCSGSRRPIRRPRISTRWSSSRSRSGLSYTWHNYQREHAELFGWGEERLAELQKERRSKVTFDLEPADDVVKLTVTHDGFAAGSPMLAAWRGATDNTGGWPELLANLKTLLETGQTFTMASSAAWRARRSPEGRRHTGG